MSLGLAAADLDWQGLRQEMPEEIFAGWRAYARKNPQGTGHFYKFLAHAFCLLAQSFHSPDKAWSLRWTEFCWWLTAEERAAADEAMEAPELNDDELEAQYDRYSKFGKSG